MVSRRRLILGGAAAAGALVIGWLASPPRQRLTGARPLAVKPGEAALNGWVKVGADDRVTVMMARVEMGQGVNTALAMLLADELDARWDQIHTEPAPIDDLYNNIATVVDGLPFHPEDPGWLHGLARHVTARAMREIGLMATGGSSSIKDLWLPMREAGASARAMLVAAAAARWGVPASECVAAEGRVSHPSGRSARFGELAAAAGALPLPATPPLKAANQRRFIGRAVPRNDTAAKLVGGTVFGIDQRLPDMRHARVTMCPTLGGSVSSVGTDAALAMPGVRAVFAVPGRHGASGAVAVIADTGWQAQEALKKVVVTWAPGPAKDFSSDAFMATLVAATRADDAGSTYLSRGDADAAFASAAHKFEATYQAPYLAHAALEPLNCTVRCEADAAEVWVGTQVPDLARMAVARVLDLPRDRVRVNTLPIGGAFGRRLEIDFIAQAAEIARQMPGVPVQTVWSREQDTTHDCYRPACAARLKAGLAADGSLVAWQSVSAGQAVVPQVLHRYFGVSVPGPDKTTAEGGFDQPYEWPHARVAHQIVDAPVPVGFWRSVGHSHQAFFKECFLDEAAIAAGKDPVAFRAALLAAHPRHLAVLRRAAEAAGWGTAVPPAPDGAPAARGVALHQSFGSIVAQVAEVSLGPDKRIRVHRVVCAIDCGTVVNPRVLRQQVEGGIVFGLSAALHGGVRIEQGEVKESNFQDQPQLRMAESPAIETLIIDSAEAPEGAGEPPAAAIAPAVGNAVFALTGQRLRALPLRLA
jgi:isoquinoline 1-oxidoreductase beta subunit